MSLSTAENQLPTTFEIRGFPHPFRRDEWPSNIEKYHFDLDADLIAQFPTPQREDSKLLLIRRNPKTGMPKFEDLLFRDLPEVAREENLHESLWIRNRKKANRFTARNRARSRT